VSADHDAGNLVRRYLSGWWSFAGVMIAIVGGLNLIDGIAALVRKEYFNERSLLYHNLQFFGWLAIIVGAIQLVTAVLIFLRSPTGAVIGVFIASVNAFLSFLAIAAYPAWSVIIMAVDALVIYALVQAVGAWSGDGEP
jgi:hypothetical protein